MKKFYFIFLVAIMYIGMNGFTLIGQAVEEESSSFSYKVILPENQHSKEVSYFDLRVTPSQEQTVIIKMTNSSEKEITVEVSLNSAKTNTNGVVEYGPSELKKDSSLKYDFADIATGEKTVKIPAKQTIDYKLNIKMPNASFDGVISGGIYMIEKGQIDGQKAMIKNEYGYLVGMLLTETDTVIKPELSLNKVYAQQQNYRNAVFVNFSNTNPAYVDKMTLEGQITKKGSKEVLYDTKQNNMRMAPNSQINFPILMNGEKMIPGDYDAHILITTENGGKWEWNQSFTITDEEADKFNKEDVSLLQENSINWWIILIIVIGIMMLGVIIFIILHIIGKKNKKRKKELRKSKKKHR
jgi:hypothetical protein